MYIVKAAYHIPSVAIALHAHRKPPTTCDACHTTGHTDPWGRRTGPCPNDPAPCCAYHEANGRALYGQPCGRVIAAQTE